MWNFRRKQCAGQMLQLPVLPSPYLALSQYWKVPARQDWKKHCGSASQVMNFIQSLTFPWTILLGVQVLPEKGLELSFLL